MSMTLKQPDSRGPAQRAVERARLENRLLQAINACSVLEVSQALDAGADPDLRISGRKTVMSVAAWDNNDWPTVTLLIERGACIDVKHDADTLLHLLAKHNQLDLVRMVLDRGGYVDTQIPFTSAFTPLMLAASSGHDQMVSLLLERGAKTTCTDSFSTTALHYTRSPAIIGQLLTCGAVVDARDGLARTPLMMCAADDFPESCALLLDHGADIHARDSAGSTALLESAARGWVNTTLMLLARGADVAIGMHDGHDFHWHCSRQPDIAAAYVSWRAQQAMRQVLGHPADMTKAHL